MSEDDRGPSSFAPSLDVYEQLKTATPAERAAIVLRLIDEHPEKRLELPAVEDRNAILDELDFSPEALAKLEEGRESNASGIDLRGADLRGASLRSADLRMACLSKADLRGALLGLAKLQGARLDGVDLRQADLAGANLSGAALGDADLREAMLEETNLSDSILRFAKFGNAILEDAVFQKADSWGANFQGATLTNADFQGALLEESNLKYADLTGANLQGCILKRANLQEAKLNGADLRGAIFSNTDLGGAVLRDAKLEGADLSLCNLSHIHLSGARLQDTRFSQDQLGGSIGEEVAGEFDQARKGYLALERAFQELGDHDAAAWAYRRRRRMQKRGSLEQARQARSQGDWKSMARFYAMYGSDQAVEWICDYGESIPRVLTSLFALYLFFTILYGVTGSVVREHETAAGMVLVTTRNPVDLAIFSLLAMTTGSIGIRLLPAHDLALTLIGVNVFLGVALVGLLGFVLGNRIRR